MSRNVPYSFSPDCLVQTGVNSDIRCPHLLHCKFAYLLQSTGSSLLEAPRNADIFIRWKKCHTKYEDPIFVHSGALFVLQVPRPENYYSGEELKNNQSYEKQGRCKYSAINSSIKSCFLPKAQIMISMGVNLRVTSCLSPKQDS